MAELFIVIRKIKARPMNKQCKLVENGCKIGKKMVIFTIEREFFRCLFYVVESRKNPNKKLCLIKEINQLWKRKTFM